MTAPFRRRARALLLALVLALPPGSVLALNGVDPLLAEGLAAWQQQQPAEAARRWERTAIATGDGPRRATAALAWVLVAQAREQAADSDGAWAAWGRATALHARAGTDWARERGALADALRAIRVRLGAAAADSAESGAGSGLSAGDALLLALDAATRISRYDGPGLGEPTPEPAAPATADAAPALPPVRRLPLRPATAAGPDAPKLALSPRLAAGKPPAAPPAARSATTRPAEPDASSSDAAAPRAGIASAAAAALLPVDDEADLEPQPSGRSDGFAVTVAAEPDRRDETDRRAAAAAWRYLATQADDGSGACLPRPDDRRVTAWHLGDCLIGLLAAGELALADGPALNLRLDRLLATLAALPLGDDGLPPAVLDLSSLLPLAAADGGADGPASADELARLLTGLALLRDLRPAQAASAEAIAARWRLERLPRQRLTVIGLREAVAALAERLPAAAAVAAAIDPPADGSAAACDHGEAALLAALETGATADLRLAALQAGSERRAGRLVVPGELALPAPAGTLWLAASTAAGASGALRACAGSAAGRDRDPELAAGAAYGWATLAGDDWGQRLRATVLALDDPRLGLRAGIGGDGRPLEVVDLHTQVLVLEAVLLRARSGTPLLNPAAAP